MSKKNKDIDLRSEVRSYKYGVYHNTLQTIKQIITTSASAQDKVYVVLQEVISAEREIAANTHILNKRLGIKD